VEIKVLIESLTHWITSQSKRIMAKGEATVHQGS